MPGGQYTPLPSMTGDHTWVVSFAAQAKQLYAVVLLLVIR
jgi:hypothetical protein